MAHPVKRTSLWTNGLIWFGAALSLAEMQTGTYFSHLGLTGGLAAILLGHALGCVLLFAVGVIGGKTRKSAMETVKMSFGAKGGLLFAFLNIVQLLGWTGIMIYEGALAASTLFAGGRAFWCVLIGLLIIFWLALGVKGMGKLNSMIMVALLLLTIVLSYNVMQGEMLHVASAEPLPFSLALELSIAMPLSWLPLISDYTKEAASPVKATAVSVLVYGFTGCWMYAIGLVIALGFGEMDIAQIMLKAGLGVGGLLIILFSTVTTTFLDAYSAGVSSESLSAKIPGRTVAMGVTVLGTIGAIFLPLLDFTEFLYVIGSVFAPMVAVQLTDYFITGKNLAQRNFCVPNLVLWLTGFLLYRLLMQADLAVGSTLPTILITMALCMIVNTLRGKNAR
ncbi:MAG: putative hydroxymethylpyrimidine transporter CytX [Selenomonadaceae bacterium]|nr:putative hydroxymethylpyrimidine transporter CytX [Selenomonadaceae bacterium]